MVILRRPHEIKCFVVKLRDSETKTNHFDLGAQTANDENLTLGIWTFSPKSWEPRPKFSDHGGLGSCFSFSLEMDDGIYRSQILVLKHNISLIIHILIFQRRRDTIGIIFHVSPYKNICCDLH